MIFQCKMAEVLDPMTLMLYELHSNLSFRELKTLTAVTNAPHDVRLVPFVCKLFSNDKQKTELSKLTT